ncbi:MAG: TonB-dependent receptor plug domain-containing protein [Gammaproteobacteria bacterium]|nr:TonB-dependent receptor plug domain-containing protein [Gammaproteobacteria bacterium]
MAATKMKWTPPRALTLAGMALLAAVTACDSDAPTAIDDALLDALANPEAAASADGSGNPVSEAVRITGNLGDGAPLIFVDGVELEGGSASLNSLNPDDIERIEVIKGEAAAGLFGERAENGVIQISTKEPSAPSGP